MTTEAPERPPQGRQIAEALIDDIVEWRIEPGTWIREREVATRFGVSHAPVREALRHVAQAGFVQIVPWRGGRVIDLDQRLVSEIFELWKSLFGTSCRIASLNFDDSMKIELLSRVNHLKNVVKETPDTLQHLRASNAAGAFVSKCAQASIADDLLNRIALFARWQHHVIRNEYLESFERRPGLRIAELWDLLYFALNRNDADGAEAAARLMIAFTQEHFGPALEAYLSERETKSAPKRRAPPS